MKKFLGIIYIIYSILITYIILTGNLNNYLAPQLQIYIKIAVIPLFFIGIIMIFNKKVTYRFKISDLILLLPIFIIIIGGDGRLSLSLAENRSTNLFGDKESQPTIKITDEDLEKVNNNTEYDFSKPDFDVIDENYQVLANYLTFSESAKTYIGKTVKVKGFTVKYGSYLADGYFALGKYIITCCAADATFGGFIIQYNTEKIRHNKWYEIEGVLEPGKNKDGNDILAIRAINVKEIDPKNESQYAYPCYSYDDGLCEAVKKYNLEY